MKNAPFTIAAILALAVAVVANADQPLMAPQRYTEYSPSKRFCVTSDPKGITFAHRPDQPATAIWTIPQWFRVLWLSDNPEILLTGYDGANLVPLEHPEDTVVLTFWRHGKEFRTFKVSDVLHATRHLRRTASHYTWGHYGEFDADGHFRLTTVEDEELVFDPEKGALIERHRSVG